MQDALRKKGKQIISSALRCMFLSTCLCFCLSDQKIWNGKHKVLERTWSFVSGGPCCLLLAVFFVFLFMLSCVSLLPLACYSLAVLPKETRQSFSLCCSFWLSIVAIVVLNLSRMSSNSVAAAIVLIGISVDVSWSCCLWVWWQSWGWQS